MQQNISAWQRLFWELLAGFYSGILGFGLVQVNLLSGQLAQGYQAVSGCTLFSCKMQKLLCFLKSVMGSEHNFEQVCISNHQLSPLICFKPKWSEWCPWAKKLCLFLYKVQLMRFFFFPFNDPYFFSCHQTVFAMASVATRKCLRLFQTARLGFSYLLQRQRGLIDLG